MTRPQIAQLAGFVWIGLGWADGNIGLALFGMGVLTAGVIADWRAP